MIENKYYPTILFILGCLWSAYLAGFHRKEEYAKARSCIIKILWEIAYWFYPALNIIAAVWNFKLNVYPVNPVTPQTLVWFGASIVYLMVGYVTYYDLAQFRIKEMVEKRNEQSGKGSKKQRGKG